MKSISTAQLIKYTIEEVSGIDISSNATPREIVSHSSIVTNEGESVFFDQTLGKYKIPQEKIENILNSPTVTTLTVVSMLGRRISFQALPRVKGKSKRWALLDSNLELHLTDGTNNRFITLMGEVYIEFYPNAKKTFIPFANQDSDICKILKSSNEIMEQFNFYLTNGSVPIINNFEEFDQQAASKIGGKDKSYENYWKELSAFYNHMSIKNPISIKALYLSIVNNRVGLNVIGDVPEDVFGISVLYLKPCQIGDIEKALRLLKKHPYFLSPLSFILETIESKEKVELLKC